MASTSVRSVRPARSSSAHSPSRLSPSRPAPALTSCYAFHCMPGAGRTFFIENLGCPKNAVEGEGMAERLQRAGYAATDSAGDADVRSEEHTSELQSLA